MFHALELDKYFKEAIHRDGFNIVEAVSYCHTTHGRMNKRGTAAMMMRTLKDNSMTKRAFEKLSPAEQAENTKIIRGVMHTNDNRIEYTRLYDQVIERAGGFKI